MKNREKTTINGKVFFVKRDENDRMVGFEPAQKEPGVMIGDYVCIRGEITDETLKAAKEELLNKVFEEIRLVAERQSEEFFIIKRQMPTGPLGEECCTVGCKLILPTVSSDMPAE